jgi:hypothetical protein
VGDAYHSPEPPPPEPSPPPPPSAEPSASIGPDQGGIVGYGQDLQSYLNDLINMSGGVGVTPAPAAPPPMAPYRPAPPLAPEPAGPEIPTPREPEAASTDGDRTSSSDEDDDAAGPTSPPDRLEQAETIGHADWTASGPDDPDDRPPPSDRHPVSSGQDEAIGRSLLRPGTRLTIIKGPEQVPAAGRIDTRTTPPQSCESSTSSHHDRRFRPRDPHLPRAPPGGSHHRPSIGDRGPRPPQSTPGRADAIGSAATRRRTTPNARDGLRRTARPLANSAATRTSRSSIRSPSAPGGLGETSRISPSRPPGPACLAGRLRGLVPPLPAG